MKQLFAVSTFYSALLFCGFALPCSAEIVFTNTNGTGTSDVSVSGTIPGANDTVTYLTSILNQITITGVPSGNGTYNQSLYLTETYCATGSNECVAGETPNVIYVTGTIGALSIFNTSFSNALLAITLSGPLTGSTTSGGLFTLTSPTSVSSISVNSTFAADLGLTNPVTLISAANVNNGGNGSYTVIQQAEVDLNTDVVPEPGTWLLMTLGISLMAFTARKRSSLAKAVK